MRPHCQTYRGNTINAIDEGNEIVEFFNTEIDPKEQILLSEDYAFCARWRRLGNPVFVAPWVRISHLGHHEFTGTLVHALALQKELVDLEAENAKKKAATPSRGPAPKKRKK
jgi:hypothetical protein